jgi:hypothetical protein
MSDENGRLVNQRRLLEADLLAHHGQGTVDALEAHEHEGTPALVDAPAGLALPRANAEVGGDALRLHQALIDPLPLHGGPSMIYLTVSAADPIFDCLLPATSVAWTFTV